jgi:two-component system cell cycle sensor histidine kinase/response regulator CckA
VENISDAVFLADDVGAFRYVCPNCSVIFGSAPEELEPRGLRGLFREPKLLDLERLRREGEIQNLEATIDRKDGSERQVLVSLKRVAIRGATVLAVFRDVTDYRALERQLRQIQKLEAVGLLAGGVAHDLRNLLAVVTASVESVTATLESPDAIEEMQDVMRAADLGADLLRKLLAFLRKADVEHRLVDVNESIQTSRRLIAGALRPATLKVELAEDLGSVLVDPVSLQQVFLNVAINARDAMPGGGTLTLTTRKEQVGKLMLVVCGEKLPHGRYVVIQFADTGVGMDESTVERIFDPFFTTKGGERSGLGLSTCLGIVRQAGGYLQVGSCPGVGSTFAIYLPEMLEPRRASATKAPTS